MPGTGYVVVDSAGKAVAGQLPIVDALPGATGYNDFVRITEVVVGADYVVNTLTSRADIDALVAGGDATLRVTERIANWSLVPAGSIATKRFEGARVDGYRAWYRGEVAHYLKFDENLSGTTIVPSSPIIVIFANDMSPAGGFAAEPDGQTHNVVATLPGDPGYSSYWSHSVGKLAGFDGVSDFASASANGAMAVPVIVNCPVVAP